VLYHYAYAISAKAWTPFKKTKNKILNNKWLALVKDINITPLPSRVGFNMPKLTEVIANY
jgi:hypothetical protein